MDVTTTLWMLVVMIVMHTIADYTPLQNKDMFKAKAEGNFWGVVPHGMWHATFVGMTVLFFGFGLEAALIAALIELVIHTLMDWTKGMIPLKYERFCDMSNWRFWTLFGVDQAVHVLTKIFIVMWLVAV